MYDLAEKMAQKKLDRIIQREGDMNGERRKSYYLDWLICEALESESFSKHCEQHTKMPCGNSDQKSIRKHYLI